MVVITDAEPLSLPGPRIVYVNDAFTKLTGYSSDEILGKTPRILHGELTDRVVLNRIEASLKNGSLVKKKLSIIRKTEKRIGRIFQLHP